MNKNVRNIIVRCATFFIYAWLLLWLWNSICTSLFNLPLIHYRQSLGILLMGELIFQKKNYTGEEDN
jgi:hypothetical protein